MLSDRFGRRKVLIFSAVMFAASSIGAAIPRDLNEFVVARFAGGLAIGVASVLAPLYIAEVSPARIRGRLVSLNQMTIVSGILLAYLINWSLSFLGPTSWRWMFAVAALPSFAFFLALFFVPESPRWLVEKGSEDEARSVLTKVGGKAEADLAMREIKEVIAEESGTLRELFEPRFRKPLIIAIALAILQQVTGINTVLFYGSIIFKEQVGSSSSSALGANVLIGLINFLSTIVALWLIDRVGRRPLLIFSAAAMGLCEIALALAFQIQPPPGYLIVGIMLMCGASFAVGLGPGVWVMLSEIFPTRVRGRAMGDRHRRFVDRLRRPDLDVPDAGESDRHRRGLLHLCGDVRHHRRGRLEVDARNQGPDARTDREALALTRGLYRCAVPDEAAGAFSGGGSRITLTAITFPSMVWRASTATESPSLTSAAFTLLAPR